MKVALLIVTAGLMTATAAVAQPSTGNVVDVLREIPANSMTVTNYYKQDVYDTANNKIGDVKDVLVDTEGKITALVVGAGGFLGMGDHDVAVPFAAMKGSKKDGKWVLTMNITKDDLKNAPGWRYDQTKTTWVPEMSSTTGAGR